MGRFFLTLALGLGLCFGAAYYFDLWPKSPAADHQNTTDDSADNGKRPVELGDLLYHPQIVGSQLVPPGDFNENLLGRVIVVPAQLAPLDKVEVGAEVEGSLLFVGEEIPPSAIAVAGLAPFTADPFRIVPLALGSDTVYKVYRRLYDGMTVNPDQMVALLNPAKAMLDVNMKTAKVNASVADQAGSEALYEESKARVKANQILYGQKAISFEELRASIATKDKYWQEVLGKRESIKLAQAELETSQHMLKQHEVRNKIRLPRSTIKQVLKNTGDTVKASEPILQLFNTEFLVAEGLLEEKNMEYVRRARQVILEPTREESPLRILKAHRNEVTGVAVTHDFQIVANGQKVKRDLIVSGSKDGRVLVWSLQQTEPVHQLETHSPVRSLACSPPSSSEQWILAGCSDGSIYLWNLAKLDEVRQVKEHRDAVTALAFSPDGAFFASGGADNNIQMWSTDKVWKDKAAKPEYPFDSAHLVGQPHRGTISSLHFIPECKLISASRDNSLRVWSLHKNGAKLDRKEEGRGGMVSQLGVSNDGNWMLFDKQQGRELQILSTQGRYLCNLDNPNAGTPFEVLALFSPDSNLLLTAGAAEGRLQLWRTPTNKSRGFEVRQYVPKEGSPVTCAAFDNYGRFAVSGCQDHHVYIWPVPTPEEIRQHRLTAKAVHLAGALDANPRQTRIGVELDNPDGRLIPGRPVTIVVYE